MNPGSFFPSRAAARARIQVDNSVFAKHGRTRKSHFIKTGVSTPYKNCSVRCRNTVWTCPVPDTLEFFVKHARSASKKLQLLYHAVQKFSGPVPEHGMDLSGAGHTRVFCKARAKRVKKLQQLYHEFLRVCPGYILREKDTG